jgi:hypothetical protein
LTAILHFAIILLIILAIAVAVMPFVVESSLVHKIVFPLIALACGVLAVIVAEKE